MSNQRTADCTNFVAGDETLPASLIESSFSQWLSAAGENTESHSAMLNGLDVNSLHELADVYDCLELIKTVWPPQIAPAAIGPFKLTRQIGGGGMGVVWEAEQTEPIERLVAIKLIRPDLFSQSAVQRFESERKLLARMDHPNIARIIEAGKTEEDQLFLAMELVPGERITDFADRHQLNIEHRIQLFLEVCSAIQHAHQKGIIHRDIKPSNILVSQSEGNTSVKIIDFGLAKLVSSVDSNASDFHQTMAGQLLGTLQYMSPEQADMSGKDVDTVSDVFSLGVVLYELLTGATPISKSSTQRDAVVDILQKIREREATSLSRKLDEYDKSVQVQVAQSRSTDFKKLRRLLGGDLGLIVAKSMEIPKERRYQTVNAFSAELRRFLNKEPVEVRQPTLRYRMVKFIQKNKKLTAAALMIGLSFFVGAIGTLSGLSRAIEAERKANDNLRQVRRSNAILSNIFDDLDYTSVENGDKRLRTVLAEQLKVAIAELEKGPIESPVETAELQLKIIKSLSSYGGVPEAIYWSQKIFHKLQDLLGIEHEMTRDAARELAFAYGQSRQFPRAFETLNTVLDFCRNSGASHELELADTINLQANFYREMGSPDKAIRYYKQVIDIRNRVLGPNHDDTLDAQFGIAIASAMSNRPTQAVKILEERLGHFEKEFGREHLRSCKAKRALAWVYSMIPDKRQESLKLAEEVYQIATKTYGTQHQQAYYALNQIGKSAIALGLHSKAKTALEPAVAGLEKTMGNHNGRTIETRVVLAQLYRKLGDERAALDLLVGNPCDFSSGEPFELHGICELAESHRQAGDHATAIKLLNQIETENISEPSDRQRVQNRIHSLFGHTFLDAKETEKAVEQFEKALHGWRLIASEFDLMPGIAVADLGKAISADGRPEEALSLLQPFREQAEKKLPTRHPLIQIIRGQIGITLAESGQLEAGIELMESVAHSGVRLKKMDYLIRNLRQAYFNAKKDEKLDRSLLSQLQRLKKSDEFGPVILVKQLRLLGRESFELESYELAEACLAQACQSLPEFASITNLQTELIVERQLAKIAKLVASNEFGDSLQDSIAESQRFGIRLQAIPDLLPVHRNFQEQAIEAVSNLLEKQQLTQELTSFKAVFGAD